MALTVGFVPSLAIRAALLPLALLAPSLLQPAQAQLVWTPVDPLALQPSAWGGSVLPAASSSGVARPAAAATPLHASTVPAVTTVVQPVPAANWVSRPAPIVAATPPNGVSTSPSVGASPLAAAPSGPMPAAYTASLSAVPVLAGTGVGAPTTTSVASVRPAGPVLTAQASSPSTRLAAASPDEIRRLREKLRIQPIVRRVRPWPSPSLNPGVPSAFVANWGDVFVSASAATPGKQRDGVVDGSLNAGFGLGDSAKAVALELSGGCGSIKDFCANGSFTARIGRLLVNESQSRLSLAAAWQNFAQWGNEGRQDNVYYGALSYAIPLQPGRPFAQTLQFNAGVGNSQYAPAVTTDSESQIGGFASLGVELTPYLGVSAGWSGRGANAQLSLTPFRDVPITVNLLGADLFNQTPAGTVGVLSISWGTNFLTPSF